MSARNARLEAQALVGERLAARVLEPSPPAIRDEWFADDPVAAAAPAGRRVIGPCAQAGESWASWIAARPEHAAWAGERWLGAYRRLRPADEDFARARAAAHLLAVYVISAARRRANGKIGLRWTLGGVGTPFFGDDEQVRLDGDRLVRQRGEAARAERVTTLAAAAALALDGPPDIAWAAEFDVPSPGDPDAPLGLTAAGGRAVGDWFGFAYSILEELRADPESTDPSRVQLWPEHFDAALDISLPAGRATFGASPGDATGPEPYLYVLLPDAETRPRDGVWNAEAFRGAVLPLSGFVEATDQRAAALEFFRGRRAAI